MSIVRLYLLALVSIIAGSSINLYGFNHQKNREKEPKIICITQLRLNSTDHVRLFDYLKSKKSSMVSLITNPATNEGIYYALRIKYLKKAIKANYILKCEFISQNKIQKIEYTLAMKTLKTVGLFNEIYIGFTGISQENATENINPLQRPLSWRFAIETENGEIISEKYGYLFKNS